MIFDQVRSFIEDNYIDSAGNGITLDVSMKPDVGSLLAQLDPPADLLSWKKMVQVYNPFSAGIGVSLRAENGEAWIDEVRPDSPASRAGLKRGDRIIRIDGEPVAEHSSMMVMTRLVGAPGSDVSVTVAGPENASRDMKISRQVLDREPAVAERFIEGRIGYVRIGAFTGTIPQEVKSAVRRLVQEGMQGLVIDLRDTSGPGIGMAAESAQIFLKQGALIGRSIGRTPELSEEYLSHGWTHYTEFPMAVLINENTSTGAELFAAALHDDKRALLIGEKGSSSGAVQSRFQLKDGSYLVLRTHYLWTPAGDPIEGIGTIPDVAVDLSPGDKAEVYRTIHSHGMWEEGDIPVDKQLAAAISALRSRVMSTAEGVR